MIDLSKINWHYVHTRQRSLWYVHVVFRSFAIQSVKMENIKYWMRHVGAIDNKVVFSKKDWQEMQNRLWNYLKKSPNFLYQQLSHCYKEHKQLIIFLKGVYKIKNYSSYSNKQLSRLIKDFISRMTNFAAYALLPLYVEDKITDEIIKQVNNDELSTILSPVKNSRELDEKISLLKISIKFKNNQNIEKDLEKHIFNYSWLKDTGYYGDYYNGSYYLNRIKRQAKLDPEKSLSKAQNEKNKQKERFNKILGKYKNKKSLIYLIKTINESIYFRSFRSEEFYRSGIYLMNLLKEISKRINIKNYKEIFNFTVFEVISLLEENKKVDQSLLKRRKESFIYITNFSQSTIYEGKESKKIAKKIKFYTINNKIIKGQTAYKGKASGSAVIVNGPDDFKKVKTGNILVASSTQPNYLPVLKKVKAVITEEGGVLSHASIISRELKIPTIIGVKAVTKILKDGDLVEVDAERGIVRKI